MSSGGVRSGGGSVGDSPTEHRAPSTVGRAEPRFTPGTLLAGRYRIIAPLGRGGMGEVYRADDVKLGQQVALKFLPATLLSDPGRVERLYQEVRIGRQVSHPNVCRLYDIGEWEGNHFLTMEYVDGEDLASLMRRIGKLPAEKGIDIARDVCAGLAAAHALGIVHRDLKPANIMIDGRGTARITDFGLAALAEDLTGTRDLAGTPAYMAPEQLNDGVATQKSDLYSLGAVLFEMFTGHRLFGGNTLNEVLAQRSASRSHVSTDTRELDPAVQRVILRCVDEDPGARPSSIHAVIAALPGGDPLQAAVDAGETPSPQMVAAAGATGEVEPRIAIPVLAALLALLIGTALIASRTTLIGQLPLEKSSEVLEDRAREVLRRATGSSIAVDHAAYTDWNEEFITWILRDKSAGRWRKLRDARPGVLLFELRQSPHELVARMPGAYVTLDDPPRDEPGMSEAWLDFRGQLTSLRVNPRPARTAGSSPPPDWKPYLADAGLDPARLHTAVPSFNLPVDYDSRLAWSGTYADQPNTEIHVEAASSHGAPVWFSVSGPWQKSVPGTEVAPEYPASLLREWTGAAFFIVGFISALVLARANLKRGRGDRKGAGRIAAFLFVVSYAGLLLRSHHVARPGPEVDILMRAVAFALLAAAMGWVLYIALEPFIRRTEPHALISWTRLLAGRFRDPMVGRDVLVGTFAGCTISLLRSLVILAPTWFGQPAMSPIRAWTSPLTEARHLGYLVSVMQGEAIHTALMLLFVIFLLTIVLRRRVLALAAITVILVIFQAGGADDVRYGIALGVMIAIIAVTVISRFGLLSIVSLIFADEIVTNSPLTLDPSSWYFGRSAFALAIIAALAIGGCFTAIGGRATFARFVEQTG